VGDVASVRADTSFFHITGLSEAFRPGFCRFWASFRDSVVKFRGNTSATHNLINNMYLQDRVLRCYSQNIDGYEAEAGILQNVLFDPLYHEGSRSTGAAGSGVVQLHGSVCNLRCTVCMARLPWGDVENLWLLSGELPPCPSCHDQIQDRVQKGLRARSGGVLRPDVVLYGETHPEASEIASLLRGDSDLGPDLLVIMGTELKLQGPRDAVGTISRAVHSSGGVVIMVNQQMVSFPDQGGLVDYFVHMTCEDWIETLNDADVDHEDDAESMEYNSWSSTVLAPQHEIMEEVAGLDFAA